MAAFTISTAAFLLIANFSLRPMWNTGPKRTFWVCAAFLLAGYALLAVVSFGARPPSPLKPFEVIVMFFTG